MIEQVAFKSPKRSLIVVFPLGFRKTLRKTLLWEFSFPTHPHLYLSKILAACCRLSHVLYVARLYLQAENSVFENFFSCLPESRFLPSPTVAAAPILTFSQPAPALAGTSGDDRDRTGNL